MKRYFLKVLVLVLLMPAAVMVVLAFLYAMVVHFISGKVERLFPE